MSAAPPRPTSSDCMLPHAGHVTTLAPALVTVADVTVYCKDKAVIHASAESSSMYASLDELADTLSRKLRKHKERRVDVKQKDRREDKNVLNEQVFDEEEDDDDFAAAA